MTCEHYWREGVALVETEQPDPHRAGCVECRREHERRQELVSALPRTGPLGDPQWQVRFWNRVECERRRRRVAVAVGGVSMAAAAVLAVWLVIPGATVTLSSSTPIAMVPADSVVATTGTEGLPRIEIIPGPLAKRSRSARVGDRVRISAHRDDEVRVYRADRLTLRCAASAPAAPGCTVGPATRVAETTIATAGEYQLVVIKEATAESVGVLAADLAAIVQAGGSYDLTDLSIR